jgi:hypothetical protein
MDALLDERCPPILWCRFASDVNKRPFVERGELRRCAGRYQSIDDTIV